MIHAVIMVGGAGTRLWPVSRRSRPKQMMKVGSEVSLLDGTFARARALAGDNVLVVATSGLADVIRKDLPGLRDEELVLEPEGRDTAACIGLAAVHVARRDPDGVMIVMPADHLIRPPEAFIAAARTAAEVAEREKCLVTIGIVPRSPATGYGYIHRGESIEGDLQPSAFRVAEFREKPDEATAKGYVESGEYYWNSGIFAWRSDVILAEIARHLPAHHERLLEIAGCVGADDEAEVCCSAYAAMEKISIDYGVMEKAERVAVVEAGFDWDDVGSWTAFAEHIERDANGNDIEGDFVGIDTRDCVVIAPGGKTVAAIGVAGLVIVETPDVLLVCPRDRDQDVKKIVAKLKEMGREELL